LSALSGLVKGQVHEFIPAGPATRR
jgi:hypothetical protein